MSGYNTIISTLKVKEKIKSSSMPGTSKTFIMNLLLAKLLLMKHTALAEATSRIAATLLSHSSFMFETPVEPV